MDSKQIINKEAFSLGLKLGAYDRKIIQNKLNITESAVNVVLSGKRRATRGKSLQVIELASRIAEINKEKENLI